MSWITKRKQNMFSHKTFKLIYLASAYFDNDSFKKLKFADTTFIYKK